MWRFLVQTAIFLCYVCIITIILIVKNTQTISALLTFGKDHNEIKAQNDQKVYEKKKNEKKKFFCSPKNLFHNIFSSIDKFKHITVPKTFFFHFYIVSISFFVFYSLLGEIIGGRESFKNQFFFFMRPIHTWKVGLKRVGIVGQMIIIHSIKRLIESLTFMKRSSKGKMNVFHYFYGMIFYFLLETNMFFAGRGRDELNIGKGEINGRSLVVILFLFSFLFLTSHQFMCHKYLAGLKKYSLPSEFKFVSCPHYFDEILIYILMVFVSILMKYDLMFVLNMIMCTILVCITLMISSSSTFAFYKKKFKEEYEIKWIVIPYLY